MNRLSLDDIRASLWAPPATAGVLAFGLALILMRVGPGASSWPGDAASASTMLQVIATAAVTVTSLTFSLVVVALQLASQQFSPRLLREFARDWVTQAVLSVLVATFVLSLTTLRAIHADQPLPALAVNVAFGMGLLSMVALVGFLAHIMRGLRVDTMMRAVHGDTVGALGFYPVYDADLPQPVDASPGDEIHLVRVPRSGFIRVIDDHRLTGAASRAGVVVELLVRPGDHVTRRTPMATWRAMGDGDREGLEQALYRGIEVGYERTLEQDVAYGFRQLADIAVKALSPGINDPATAAHAVGYMGDLLVQLCGRSTGPRVHCDADGIARIMVPGRDLRYYLDLACQLIRRFGRREPTALLALLAMLRDVAVSARDDRQRAEIDRQVELILSEMSADLIDEDARTVRDMSDRVRRVLAGDVAAAFVDRSGETRSS